MASQALQAFRRTIEVDWQKGHEQAAKLHLIATARAGHAQIMRDATARSGSAPAFEAYANSPGRAIEAVVLPGPIVYRYRYMREIVYFALDELRKASPMRSGDYVRGHTIFVNGVPVQVLPPNLKPSDEIWIANPIPYSRRLEIGKTQSGRDFLIQVPNRIYERTAKKVVSSRYRNVAKVTFGYITIPDAYRLKQNQVARHWLTSRKRWYNEPSQRADRAKGSAVKSPAIFIEGLA